MAEQDRAPKETNVVVVVGGERTAVSPDSDDLQAEATRVARRSPLIVAADSGVQFAAGLGLTPHHIVGDLDSVDPTALQQAIEGGAQVHRFATDKDATDIELGVELVDSLVDGTRFAGVVPTLTVLGPGGGRLDHLLADLLLVSTPRLHRFDVSVRFGASGAAVVVPGRTRELRGRPGEILSLLPVHGEARGINTSGLRWPLVDAVLAPGTTRGVSNAFLGVRAQVSLETGALLALQPGASSGPVTPRTTPYDPTPRR